MHGDPRPLAAEEIEALARAFSAPISARHVLLDAGLGVGRQPPWQGTAQEYWREVSLMIGSGVLPDGRRALLAAAARFFPANPVFAGHGREQPAHPGDAGPPRDAAGRASAAAPRGGQEPVPAVWIGGAVSGQIAVGDDNTLIDGGVDSQISLPGRAVSRPAP